MGESLENYTGIQKAAILLIAMGTDTASEIFKLLKNSEIEKLSIEMARLKKVSTEVMEAVVEEFYKAILAQEYQMGGGTDYTRALLEKSFGHNQARKIMEKVDAATHVSGFDRLRDVDPTQLLNFLQHEHPQTIALVVAYLDASIAAHIISSLSVDVQREVVYRVATMSRISPEMVKILEGILEMHAETISSQISSEIGGAHSVAQILNSIGRSTEIKIMEDLNRRNPELAEEIRNLMFTFEDIQRMDDHDVRILLKKVKKQTLALALKGTPEEQRVIFHRNLSSRARAMLEEEIEFLGPVRKKDVELAQMEILENIRSLEEEGIIFPRRDDEYVE